MLAACAIRGLKPPASISHSLRRRPGCFSEKLPRAHRTFAPAYPRAFFTSSSSQTLSTSESGDDAEEEEEIVIHDPGDYEMIGPPEGSGVGYTPKERYLRHHRGKAIEVPPYATPEAIKRFRETGEHVEGDDGEALIRLGTDEELQVRRAGALAAHVLRLVGASVMAKPRLTTEHIDDMVFDLVVRKYAAYPSPLYYKGYPRSCCTSVNNIVAHGIPDGRILRDGDIVNVDITLYLNGYHGDTSRTFSIGHVDKIGRDLIKITEEALEAGVSACGPGRPFRDVAKAIHGVVHGSGHVVCPSFTGHGIGRAFHQRPWIYHDLNDEPEVMKPGHCFTIEPCIIKGDDPSIGFWPDGWTATTASLARSAQAEHMVLITETGADVLTKADTFLGQPMIKLSSTGKKLVFEREKYKHEVFNGT